MDKDVKRALAKHRLEKPLRQAKRTFQIFASQDDGDDIDLGTFKSRRAALAAMKKSGNIEFGINTFEGGQFASFEKVWIGTGDTDW